MTQQQIGALAALACYTVDSDFESEGEEEVMIKQEVVVKEEVVVKDDDEKDDKLMVEENQETKECSDFGELYIKPEPLWEVDTEGHVEPQDVVTVEFMEPQDIKVEIESDSECDSSSSDSDSDSEVENEVATVREEKEKEDTEPVRSKNEMTHKDLPPVEDLEVRVAVHLCQNIGLVSSIVDDLVVIESMLNKPALDLESVLFLKSEDSGGGEGSQTLDLLAMGRIFDVIGPVTRPYYVVRFNSQDHVQSKGGKVGQEVFFAPTSEHTSFVFLDQLMNMKISDASWCNDEEPPPQFLDYSDDEQETRAKQERKIAKMVEKGADPGEVEVKRARITKGSRGRGRGEGDCLPTRHDNGRHDNGRHNNGLYAPHANPFYRQARKYDPRDSGPVKWADYGVPGQAAGWGQTSGPPHPSGQPSYPAAQPSYPAVPPSYPSQPPPYPAVTSYSPAPSSYTPAVSPFSCPPPNWRPAGPDAVQSAGWQAQYHAQHPARPRQHPTQTPAGHLTGLWRAPPPPPPQ